MGFKNSGYNIETAVEIDKWASETLQKNFPKSEVFTCSANEFLKKKLKKYDVIIGGPPCQGYSIAASNRRKKDDTRNQEYKVFLKLILEIKPKAILFENVPEIIKFKNSKNQFIVDEIKNVLESAGYFTTATIINSADFGVPQFRKRFILVGTKKKKYVFPNPSHIEKKNLLYQSYITLWDAISDLPSVKPKQYKEGEVLKYTKKVQNNFQETLKKNNKNLYNHISMQHTERTIKKFNEIRNHKTIKKTYDQNHRVLKKDRPSPTITASFYSSFIHPEQNRNLTAREAARIQTFPDSFTFCGKKTTLSKSLLRKKGIIAELHLDQFNQIGNAVPVLLSQILSKELKRFL